MTLYPTLEVAREGNTGKSLAAGDSGPIRRSADEVHSLGTPLTDETGICLFLAAPYLSKPATIE